MIRHYILTIAIAVLFISCTNNDTPADNHGHDHAGPAVGTNSGIDLTSAQVHAAGIETAMPSFKMMFTPLLVHGILEVPPQNLISIHAILGGIVKKTTIIPGEQVHKGQVLVILENPEFITLQEEYLTTKAQTEQAELDLTRQQTLAADNVNARKSLEQAGSQASVLRIRKKALAERLALIGIDATTLTPERISRQISLTAPFSGYVTTLNVNIGTAVEPNGKVLELVDPSHIHAELQVFERDVPQLHQGQTFTVVLSGEQRQRSGHIHLIGSEISTDKTVSVHGHLDSLDPTLRPGRTITATIATDPHEALTVPESALIQSGGKSWVYVQDSPGRYKMVIVTVGSRANGYVEVKGDGLDTTHEVVVKGAQALAAH